MDIGIQEAHPTKQASKTRMASQRCFSRAIRTADYPQRRSFHDTGGLSARCGSLQRVRLGFGECSHQFRGEFRRVRVNRLLPFREKVNEVQRLALQSRRQGLGLLKNFFRSAHAAKVPVFQ